jgi:hypothetical protein
MICIARIRNSPFPEFCCPATDDRGRTIKAYHIDSSGRVDGIVLRSSEGPATRARGNPEAGANPLNYRDLMILKGGGRDPTKILVVPLLDDAGEVAAIGEGVTRVKIGDQIAGCLRLCLCGTISPRYAGGSSRGLH